MEYSDNLISCAEDFAKMAKAYNLRLKREKLYVGNFSTIEQSLIEEIIIDLNKLYHLYKYIKKNIQTNRIKNIFLNMEEICKKNIETMKEKFYLNAPLPIKQFKSTNFSLCLKLATLKEAELMSELIKLTNFQNCQFVINIISQHLENIKKIAKF